MEDIRWRQSFNQYQKALMQLTSAVELSKQRSLSQLEEQGLIKALDELLLPYKIDLSLFSTIENEDLIDHIARIGKIFYQTPAIS